MNTSNEDTDSSNTKSSNTDASNTDASNTDASNTDASNTDASNTDASGESAGAPESAPVTAEEWTRLRAPFSREAYIVDNRAVGYAPRHLGGGPEEGNDLLPVVADLRLRPEAIRDRLDRVLGPGRWSSRLEVGPQAGGHYSLLCHLQVGSARRTGPGTGSSLRAAHRVALAGAAVAFGIGASGRSAGPVEAEMKIRNEVPDRVLEALEQKTGPSRSAPDEA